MGKKITSGKRGPHLHTGYILYQLLILVGHQPILEEFTRIVPRGNEGGYEGQPVENHRPRHKQRQHLGRLLHHPGLEISSHGLNYLTFGPLTGCSLLRWSLLTAVAVALTGVTPTRSRSSFFAPSLEISGRNRIPGFGFGFGFGFGDALAGFGDGLRDPAGFGLGDGLRGRAAVGTEDAGLARDVNPSMGKQMSSASSNGHLS